MRRGLVPVPPGGPSFRHSTSRLSRGRTDHLSLCVYVSVILRRHHVLAPLSPGQWRSAESSPPASGLQRWPAVSGAAPGTPRRRTSGLDLHARSGAERLAGQPVSRPLPVTPLGTAGQSAAPPCGVKRRGQGQPAPPYPAPPRFRRRPVLGQGRSCAPDQAVDTRCRPAGTWQETRTGR